MQIKINPMNPSHRHATTYSHLQYNLLLFLNVDQKIVLLLLFFSACLFIFVFLHFFAFLSPKYFLKKKSFLSGVEKNIYL